MTPRKAKEMLGLYFGGEAVNAFDPLWPETMLGVAPGVDREEVIAALRQRLTQLAEHPLADDDDAHLFARVLRSVAAQMIDGPGADWSAELEAELDAPNLRGPVPLVGGDERADRVVARLPREPITPEAERTFRKQARAIVATAGASPRTFAQLYALAEADGLSPAVVERFLSELVTPVESEPGGGGGAGAPARSRITTISGHGYTYATERDRSSQGLWIAAGAVVTLAIVAFSIFAIVAITNKQSAPPTPPTPVPPVTPTPAPGPDGVNSADPSSATPNTPTPPTNPRRNPSTADGPPDGRVFARTLSDALKPEVSAVQRERTILAGIATMRRWWPRIDPASRVAAVQFIVAGAVDLSQNESSREALINTLRAVPVDPSVPAAVWHTTASTGLAAVLSRERELPAPVLQACKDILAATAGQASLTRRSGSTFDESAADTLLIVAPTLLRNADQPASVTQAQADHWLTALRAATGVGGSADDAARRTDSAILDTVERLLTSAPNASANRSVFDFSSALLAQARFREGDAGRDRVLAWFADPRLSSIDLHLITAAVATRSAAAGIESTMVLSPASTQADRDDMRAKYAEAWSRATANSSGGSGGTNGDWYDASRSALAAAGTATGDLEQLAAAATLARLSQTASLRSRGLPGPVPTGEAVPSTTPSPFRATFTPEGGGGDGEWARRFLAESRTATARLSRIAEFEQLGGAGPIDCEVLAEAAMLSTGETRAAAQRAALKRVDDPTMVNAVLETLPKVKRSANTGEFLGKFTLAGALPPTSERWGVHFRKALVERLLTLLAFTNTTIAADRASVVLAESWSTIAGTTVSASGAVEVAEIDGPTESVAAASRAYTAIITQVRQQVPAPTALIHPDTIDRARAGRLLVARGLPQAFAANQVSAVEALAVLVAAERPAAVDQCRALITGLNLERAASRSVAAQIRATEATALRLWALRLGEPL